MKGLSLSTPMVIAWNEGRKTVTRRLMNPQPSLPFDFTQDGQGHRSYVSDATFKFFKEDTMLGGWWFSVPGMSSGPYKPRYLPGETVYIKEAWMAATPDGGESFGILYRATLSKPWTDVQWQQSFKPDNRAEKYFNGKEAWRSPRFMPEWASRSHARIVSVRPERIQEITEEEAKREGFAVSYEEVVVEYDQIRQEPIFARENFQTLWETLHPGSWEKNEFVFRYALEKI